MIRIGFADLAQFKKNPRYIPWWKIDNILMTTGQLYEVGLLGNLERVGLKINRQLKLWID